MEHRTAPVSDRAVSELKFSECLFLAVKVLSERMTDAPATVRTLRASDEAHRAEALIRDCVWPPLPFLSVTTFCLASLRLRL